MLRCAVTGKPAWNSFTAPSMAVTTVIYCDERVIHTLLSEAVRGTLAHRPHKQREVALSLTHGAAVVQPPQTERVLLEPPENGSERFALSLFQLSSR